MKKIVFIFALFALTKIVYSQQLSTPGEILKLLTDSKIKYVINEQKDKKFVDTNKYDALNTPDYYQIYDGNSIKLNKFEITDDIKGDFEQGEKEFFSGNYEKARQYYQNVLTKKPKFTLCKTYIGQTYRYIKDFKNAEKWYKSAIKDNYIDYMAHWFLANIYIDKDKKKDALNEILIAHVLNRNNPRIFTDLLFILEKNKLTYDVWYFSPEIDIIDSGTTKHLYYYNLDWFGYGLCKLAWKFEDNYRISKVGNSSGLTSIEEMECLASVYIYQKNTENKSKNPQIMTLVKALDKKQIMDFIFYEIWFPKYPIIAYTQPKDKIENIVKYLKASRIYKK